MAGPSTCALARVALAKVHHLSAELLAGTASTLPCLRQTLPLRQWGTLSLPDELAYLTAFRRQETTCLAV